MKISGLRISLRVKPLYTYPIPTKKRHTSVTLRCLPTLYETFYKMLFINPYHNETLKNTEGIIWDGYSQQPITQAEVLLQRGSRFRIICAKFSGSWDISVMVLSQTPKELKVVWDGIYLVAKFK